MAWPSLSMAAYAYVKNWLCADVNISDAVNETNVMTFLEEVAHQFEVFVDR